MAKFVKGDVVVVPFPFSELSQSKRRPALVIATLDGDDLILCQITSQTIKDNYSLSLDDKDFETGGLKQPSNLRPNRIFTADRRIVLYRVGNLKSDKLSDVVEKIVEIIRGKNRTSDNTVQTTDVQTLRASFALERYLLTAGRKGGSYNEVCGFIRHTFELISV